MTDRDGEDQAFVDAISEWPNIDDGPTLAGFLLARIAEDEYRVRNSPYPRDAAECAAKRRIVEHEWSNWGTTETLRLLALPYADHSDYQEAWRP